MNDQHALNRERYARRITDWLVSHFRMASVAPGHLAHHIRELLAIDSELPSSRQFFQAIEKLAREARPASDETWLRVAELLEMRCAMPADPFADDERSDTR